MQMVVNPLGKGPADALHPGQIADAGLKDALQAAELTQQRTTTLWPEAGNAFKTGSPAGLRTALAVPRNRKAVCFITYLLYQMQGGRISRQFNPPPTVRQKQLFLAWA